MDFDLGKNIKNKNINFFIIISFFFIFLGFVLSKGFIKNEEFSDTIFLISSVVLLELIYLASANQIINYNSKHPVENWLLIGLFFFIFLIWNSEVIYSYKNLLIFFFFKFFLTIPLVLFINYSEGYKIGNNKIDFFSQILILSILLTGLFYQISYTSSNFFILIATYSAIVLATSFIFKKLNKWIDIFFALFVFLLLFKVFLLSSDKDSFHYSWFLGPINSISDNYKLLDNVVSQYGFLNILIINKLSIIFKINSVYVLCSFIIILFIIYFKIFYLKVSSIVKLPLTIITLFSCSMIFGNIGFTNLAGAMFIPSSSVFRFLPSLLTILIFSEIIKSVNKNNILLISFAISILVSLLWSFESAIFVIISIGSFYLFKIFFNLLNRIILKKNYPFNIKDFKIETVLILSLTIVFILLNNTNTFSLFYEHALNSKGSLSEEIVNNKVTLVLLYLLVLSYLILRDSFEKKNIFYFNVLWFGLFVAYSGYFLVRSVDGNIFNILPFIFFIICSMKTNSIQIRNLRIHSIYVIVFFTIISSLLSIKINKDKFFNNLISENYFNTPKFLNKNYLPKKEILNRINEFPKTPLTLVTGKTLHIKNDNLPQYGYGLPILPLEHFNILKQETKQDLMNKYFSLNKKHLLLCTNECKFYNSNTDSNIYYKIFLGNNLKFEKIAEVGNKKSKEILYVLTTK